jgi:hypothetical protein
MKGGVHFPAFPQFRLISGRTQLPDTLILAVARPTIAESVSLPWVS